MDKKDRKNSSGIATSETGSTQAAVHPIKPPKKHQENHQKKTGNIKQTKRKNANYYVDTLPESTDTLSVKLEQSDAVPVVKKQKVVANHSSSNTAVRPTRPPNSKRRGGKSKLKDNPHYTVSDCILAMRESPAWPDTDSPHYSNEAAKITLHVKSNWPIERPNGRIDSLMLANPLSLDRSVCLFSDPVDLDTECKALETLCTVVGVTGESEVLPVPVVLFDQKLIKAAIRKFDTLLATPGLIPKLKAVAKQYMLKKGKRIFTVDLSDQPAVALREALSMSCLWFDAYTNIISISVGDSSLSHEELEENIISILAILHNKRSLFGKGLNSAKVALSVGDGDFWNVHVNHLAAEWEKPRKAKREFELRKREYESKQKTFDFSA